MAKSKEKRIVSVVSVDDALAEFANLSFENKKLIERVEKINELIDSVAKERIAQGITQRDLAELTNIKQPMIARFEKAEMMPRIDTFIKIISALDMDLKLVSKYDCDFEEINISFKPIFYKDRLEDIDEGVYYGTNNKSELPCQA